MEGLNISTFSEISLTQLTNCLGIPCPENQEGLVINAACGIGHGRPGSVTFLAQEKYQRLVKNSKASVLITDHGKGKGFPGLVLNVPNAYVAWAQCLELVAKDFSPWVSGIHPEAHVHPSAIIAPNASIGQGVTIEDHVVIHPGVVVYPHCHIGSNSILHANASIGADGFGFAPDPSAKQLWHKIPHIGGVHIGRHVEIGANTCIDRAVVGQTVIGEGTKIDNLCQIGHNVILGEQCIIAAQVAIAGSATIGDGVRIGGQSGIVGHINIGNNVSIGGGSGVTKSIADGQSVMGYPALPVEEFRRNFAASKTRQAK